MPIHVSCRWGLRCVLVGNALSIAALMAGACSKAEVPAAPDGAPRLQGQVPLEDQESGRSLRPYMDNMRLVGQQDIQNRGENGNLAWLDDCAYVSAYFGGTDPLMGMAVIDASTPTNPELIKLMPGTPGTRESQIEANEKRRIVIVMPFRHPKTPYGDPPGPTQLQIYQAPADCKAITRVGTYDFGEIITHEHRISSDGNTVYASVGGGGGAATDGKPQPPSLIAVDITDLTQPKEVARWDLSDEPGMPDSGMHDLDINDEGTRAYTATSWTVPGISKYQGLTILDISQVAQRVPDAKIRRISSLNWGPPEFYGVTHTTQLATIQGRQYVIALDETVGPGYGSASHQEKAPWGWGRIIDITAERNPLQISTIKIDAADARYTERTNRDNAVYGAHYIGVDDPYNTSLVFITWYSSGLRVFDIRDPYTPKEIGSYIPGARTNTKLPVSTLYPNHKVDYAYSFVRYRPETGHIWFNSLFNGFQIVELIESPIRGGRSAN